MIENLWLQDPERCCATVYRQFEEEACDKPAVAVAVYDGEEAEPHSFPVCKHHARGRTMLPLSEIIEQVRREKA